MGEQAGAQRVAGVQALYGAQVTRNLRHTLPETQRQEVQGQSVGVKITYRQRERERETWSNTVREINMVSMTTG